jgi:hypothetical protein
MPHPLYVDNIWDMIIMELKSVFFTHTRSISPSWTGIACDTPSRLFLALTSFVRQSHTITPSHVTAVISYTSWNSRQRISGVP